MTKKEQQLMSNKWLLVIKEYEQIKSKTSKHFKTVDQLCEVFSVHRKDIRKYYERWCKSSKDPESLLPRKPGPRPGQLKILSKEEERTIVKIHRRLNANEFEIYHLIEGKFNVHPSVSTIYRTLKRYPLNKKRKEAVKRYEKKYPGELLHADTYSLAKTMMMDRNKYYLFGAIDDCTRLCYVKVIERQTAQQATDAFFKAYKWFNCHGVIPEKVMTDNGVEFTAFTSQKAKETHFFESMLNVFGVRHVYTKPYRPQTNGKIERFWGILNNECLLTINKTINKQELELELNGFMYRYNYQRRHSALNYNTPLDKLKKIVNLLPEL
ncbi:MAG: DDE-type integrase/transposase/recombinase [Bacteroidetes bacterium]|nr:DDE-type integrase/transposase/recombinase [Bacteroidota bacterium]